MYEFDSRVRYSEVDHHGTMTVPALINYFQDCSNLQQNSRDCLETETFI